MPRTAFYFIQSAMTGFIVSLSPHPNRVSFSEAFEWLEPDEGKLSSPVLRGPGSREAAWLLGSRQLVVWGTYTPLDSQPCRMLQPNRDIATMMLRRTAPDAGNRRHSIVCAAALFLFTYASLDHL
jgi:hypothetical protein